MHGRVSLFVTCVVDQIFPRTGMAAAEVLERLGYEVEFRREQTCCGQPAFNSGFHSEARSVAEHLQRTFRDAEYVVVPSGSCAAMIVHHQAELFADDPALLAQARSLAGRVYEFSQFLLNVAGVEDVGARFARTVTYHDGCHGLRELHIKSGPRRLLRSVRDLELREMDTAEECCGFGGTFAVKFAELSSSMARTKVDAILRTGADTVVSADPSCLMQLQGVIARAKLPLKTMHLAEVLACR